MKRQMVQLVIAILLVFLGGNVFSQEDGSTSNDSENAENKRSEPEKILPKDPRSDYNEASGLRELLERIRRGEPTSDRYAADVMVRVGESGHPEFIPLLEAIIEAYSTSTTHAAYHVSYHTCHALWLLGKPLEYFLELAQSFETKPAQAGGALLVLGRWPNDPRVAALVERIHSAESEVVWSDETEALARVQSAAAETRIAITRAKEYAELTSVEEKVQFLRHEVTFGWPVRMRGNDRLSNSGKPRFFWAQRELFMLSEEYPEVVANVLVKSVPGQLAWDDDSLANYRSYLAVSLAPEAHERLKRMLGDKFIEYPRDLVAIWRDREWVRNREVEKTSHRKERNEKNHKMQSVQVGVPPISQKVHRERKPVKVERSFLPAASLYVILAGGATVIVLLALLLLRRN